MNTPASPPDDPPTPLDREPAYRGPGNPPATNPGVPPGRRSSSLLWLLLLVALLLMGWWWFSQRGAMEAIPGSPPGPVMGEPAADAAGAEKVAAEARKKAAAAREKPSRPAKPAAPRMTEARPVAGQDPQPEYPREAQRRGQSGRVLLRVDVGTDGSAARVDFVQRSGSAELDRAAMNAVRKWRFTPARRNGQPVASSVNVPVDFVLPPG